MDEFGQLRLKEHKSLCLIWFGRELKVSSMCKSDGNSKKPEYKFIFDHENKAIHIAMTDDPNFSHIGISRKNKYGPLKLFQKNSVTPNYSVHQFYLKNVIYASAVPSVTPTLNPTESISPTSIPSECVDEPDWVVGGVGMYATLTCDAIASSVAGDVCEKIESYADSTFKSKRVSCSSDLNFFFHVSSCAKHLFTSCDRFHKHAAPAEATTYSLAFLQRLRQP